jgi:hypothetical protein
VIPLDLDYKSNQRLNAIAPLTLADDLQYFEGTYVSTEIETSYRISSAGNQLYLEFAPGVKFPLFRITKMDFVFEYSGANFIQFTKDGLQFSREGVWKLDFTKH